MLTYKKRREPLGKLGTLLLCMCLYNDPIC